MSRFQQTPRRATGDLLTLTFKQIGGPPQKGR
jgi:hypothetical protein